MVRLGVFITFESIQSTGSFNSSMVRLGGQRGGFSELALKFQFQYGAIGRENLYHFWNLILLFQFQYGAIGRSSTSVSGYCFVKFQFQYGAIGRPVVGDKKSSFKMVSIPVWCDWE